MRSGMSGIDLITTIIVLGTIVIGILFLISAIF